MAIIGICLDVFCGVMDAPTHPMPLGVRPGVHYVAAARVMLHGRGMPVV